MAAFFPRADVVASGDARTFVRPSDSGYDVIFHFCPSCGSTVYWKPVRKPDLIGVAVGSFADPSFPAPTQAVHHELQYPWAQVRD